MTRIAPLSEKLFPSTSNKGKQGELRAATTCGNMVQDLNEPIMLRRSCGTCDSSLTCSVSTRQQGWWTPTQDVVTTFLNGEDGIFKRLFGSLRHIDTGSPKQQAREDKEHVSNSRREPHSFSPPQSPQRLGNKQETSFDEALPINTCRINQPTQIPKVISFCSESSGQRQSESCETSSSSETQTSSSVSSTNLVNGENLIQEYLQICSSPSCSSEEAEEPFGNIQRESDLTWRSVSLDKISSSSYSPFWDKYFKKPQKTQCPRRRGLERSKSSFAVMSRNASFNQPTPQHRPKKSSLLMENDKKHDFPRPTSPGRRTAFRLQKTRKGRQVLSQQRKDTPSMFRSAPNVMLSISPKKKENISLTNDPPKPHSQNCNKKNDLSTEPPPLRRVTKTLQRLDRINFSHSTPEELLFRLSENYQNPSSRGSDRSRSPQMTNTKALDRQPKLPEMHYYTSGVSTSSPTGHGSLVSSLLERSMSCSSLGSVRKNNLAYQHNTRKPLVQKQDQENKYPPHEVALLSSPNRCLEVALSKRESKLDGLSGNQGSDNSKERENLSNRNELQNSTENSQRNSTTDKCEKVGRETVAQAKKTQEIMLKGQHRHGESIFRSSKDSSKSTKSTASQMKARDKPPQHSIMHVSFDNSEEVTAEGVFSSPWRYFNQVASGGGDGGSSSAPTPTYISVPSSDAVADRERHSTDNILEEFPIRSVIE